MAKIADLTIKVSAQIAELQKSFDDAFGTVSKFEKQYSGIASSMEARQQELKKAFSSFAGDNLIREASVITEAISKVGGAAKLTESEQKRANATLTEAIAKYKALGETAPKALLDMAKATAQVQPPAVPAKGMFDGLISSAAGVATGMLTAQAAIGAVSAALGLVKGAVDSTLGALQDAVEHTAKLGDELFTLSQKTGVSVENLSAFKFVAGQTNTSLESISGAVFKLEANLGKGAKETTAAIGSIGLSLKDLQAQDPADAFGQIISKLGEIPNASDRAAAGVAIFGKSFKDIAQLTQEDLPGLINQAKELGLVMSTETAVGADRFGDAMGAINGVLEGLRLQIGAKVIPALVAFAEVFGGVFIDAVTAASSSTKGLGQSFEAFVVFTGQAAAKFLEILALMADGVTRWAQDTTIKVTAQAEAFLSLSKVILEVARIADLANGGANGAIFDALSSKVDSLRKGIEATARVALTGGDSIRAFASSVGESAKGIGSTFEFTFAGIQVQIKEAADKMRASLKSVGDGGAEGESKLKGFDKTLAELSKQIENAVRSGKDLPALLRLFGTEADKAATEAEKLGRSATNSVGYIAAEFRQAGLEKTLTKLDDQFSKFFSSRAEAQFKKLQASMHESGQALVDFSKLTVKAQDSLEAFGNAIAKRTFDRLATGLSQSTSQVIAELTNPFKKAFTTLGQELPQLISRGFQQGGVSGAIIAVAEGASQKFSQIFQAGLDRVAKDGGKLTGKEFGAGMAAAALQSFTTGFAAGVSDPSTVNALTSVLGGLLTGFAVGGPLGAGIGAGIGLASFIAGAFKNAAEEAKRVGVEQDRLLTQFHGLQGLTDAARRAGFSVPSPRTGERLSTDESVRFLLDTRDADVFNDIVGELNRSLDATNEKLKAIASSADAVNRRTINFGKQFEPLVAKRAAAKESGDTGAAAAASQQIQELAQRTQPEFERISLFVRDTFAAIVRETGDAIGAINQLAPSFELLKKGITDFGLTSSTVIDSLVGTFDLVNNDAFKPFFENIQASGQLLKGLFDANVLSPDTFQAAAADIGQSIQEIINRGGDMAKTIALSAPQLQTLWEAQQRYGTVTDQTTQSILDQAVAQGVVGEQFRDVNERILDVLVAIGDALGARIPDALRGLPSAAQEAGTGVRDSLGGAFDEVAGSVDVKIGGALRNVKVPAGEAGDEMRKALATQAEEAAKDMKGSLGGAFDDVEGRIRTVSGTMRSSFQDAGVSSGERIEKTVGGAIDGLAARARTAADKIGGELDKIKAPSLTVKVDFDVNDPKWKYQGDWNRQGGNEWHPDPIPLATGGIVRRPTLALVGESGPEAVIPLSRMASMTSRGGPTTVILQVEGREFGRAAIQFGAEEAYSLGLVPR